MNPYQGQPPAQYGAPPPPQAGYGQGMGQLVLKVDYFFMQWILLIVTPKIRINGQLYRKPWGTHVFDLPAGVYDVACSYPYMFFDDCCSARTQVQITPGMRTFVNYSSAFFVFMSGSIFVAGQQPMQVMQAAGGWGQPQLPPQGGAGGGYGPR